VIIVIFCLHYAAIIRIPFFMMESRFDAVGVSAKHGMCALILVAAFAFVWTRCIGSHLRS